MTEAEARALLSRASCTVPDFARAFGLSRNAAYVAVKRGEVKLQKSLAGAEFLHFLQFLHSRMERACVFPYLLRCGGWGPCKRQIAAGLNRRRR
jgi:hypothetical protein